MKAHPETIVENNILPVNRIPEWEQFPQEKREELTRILAGMLLKQVQEAQGQHEQPS
jgi:hypothetical protein